MNFEIDISGEDLLSKDYVICIANKEGIIKGFKFNNNLVNILCARYGQGKYKYKKSKKDKSTFKVRLYCIIIYYLFKSLKLNDEIFLTICRDFSGREKEIKETLVFFLEKNLRLKLNDSIYFSKLNPESNAHKYAYLMRLDNKNKMSTYINISIEDIEQWLKK